MNELLGLDPDIPLFFLVPLFVFGPIFMLVLYNLGLKDLFNPPAKIRERRRLIKLAKQNAAIEHQSKLKDAGLDHSSLHRSPLQWAGQALTFVLFALSIAWLSTSPAYVANDPTKAIISLSLTHPGQRKEKCRKLTAEETQKLAVNMRSGMSCSRERWPLVAELIVDGERVFYGVARPAGLAKDGHSSFYEKFPIAAGSHRIELRLRDEGGEEREGYDYTVAREVDLKASRILLVSFDNPSGRPTIGRKYD